MCSIAGFVSIFATIGTTRSPISARSSLMSLGAAHERLRDQVDAQVERASEPFAVAVGDRRAGSSRSAGTFTPWPERTVPPRTHSVRTTGPSIARHRQLDRAVGQQDAVAGPQVVAPDPGRSSTRRPRRRRRPDAARTAARARAERIGVQRARAAPSGPGGRRAPRAPGRPRPRRRAPSSTARA